MKVDGVTISGITCDSRKVKTGYAFVAIKGENKDGNDYIDMAIENGATIIYSEEDIKNKAVPIITVNNARKKLSELLNEFYDFPSEKLKLIGVTGTNGKTTTTYLIEEIFRKAGYKTGLIGTLGVKIGNTFLASELTTPDPEVLYYVLNKMVKEGVHIAIMEVSSHGLKLYRTHGLKFDVAIHTNIDKDHMNLHRTLSDYIISKKMLFDSLDKNKLAIINIDDNNGIKLVENNNKVLVATYGLDAKSTVTASTLEISKKINFNMCLQRGVTTINGEIIYPFEMQVDLNLMGRHNIYNALAAITAALYFNISMDDIKKALDEFIGVSRRLEKIYDEDFLVIDDFSHNPASYDAVLETIQTLDYNKVVIVTSIRGNRGVEVNKDNANIISYWYNILGNTELIISLSNDTVKENDRVSDEELLAMARVFKENQITYDTCINLEDAIRLALEKVERNDILLLLGAQGMNQGKEVLYNLLETHHYIFI